MKKKTKSAIISSALKLLNASISTGMLPLFSCQPQQTQIILQFEYLSQTIQNHNNASPACQFVIYSPLMYVFPLVVRYLGVLLCRLRTPAYQYSQQNAEFISTIRTTTCMTHYAPLYTVYTVSFVKQTHTHTHTYTQFPYGRRERASKKANCTFFSRLNEAAVLM